MVLQQKPLEKADFIVTITGPVMVRPASSDKWKAPLVSFVSYEWLQLGNKESSESRLHLMVLV